MRPTIYLILLLCANSLTAQQYTWNSLPDRTFPDSTHAPFILGIASSEPSDDAVYLWTYAEPDSFTQTGVPLTYEVSTDSTFSSILRSGNLSADSSRAYTAHLHLTGLAPDTYYWYRFTDSDGHSSPIGRTRTLPTNSVDIKFAVTSCSNIVAYYNSYARLAERNDLNAILHLGDWAYDNHNEDRDARIMDPNVDIACGLEERRKKDYLHLLDPDLRAVRARHPFIQLMDNHDVQRGETEALKEQCRQVFRDFTGQPVFSNTYSARQYRKISLGPLVDLFMIDVQYTVDQRDSVDGYESYLGADQQAWLLSQLEQSTAKWKLVGNQKQFSQFNVTGLVPLVADGVDPDEVAWNVYSAEREAILKFIRAKEIDNVMMLCGDAHMAIVTDLALDPFDNAVYNGATGEGAICVEYLPSGVSSPNVNERGVPASLNGLLRSISQGLNPHQVYMDFMDNGYGIIHIRPDSITAETWLLDAQTANSGQYLANTQVLLNGANHWKRAGDTYVNAAEEIAETGLIRLFPNPARNQITVEFLSRVRQQLNWQILDLRGQELRQGSLRPHIGINQLQIHLTSLASGMYIFKMESAHGFWRQRFSVQ